MKKYILLNLCVLTLVFGSCQQKNSSSETQKLYEREVFKTFWYAGKAEINSYKLKQSRYGEQRNGNAVLIFVTEDFSKKKQVKLDDPNKAANDKISILKLNFTKNFITGIYPYSMMLSVFSPINRKGFPTMLKTTMSSQEWCGQVFTQMNLKEDGIDVRSYSYFEQESDTEFSLKKILLEDELWNIIRLDPSDLPIGNIELIPGLFFTRLNHVELKPQAAVAEKIETGSSVVYTVSFPEQKRKLAIQFQKNFPHRILGWSEEFKERDKIQHTIATLDKTLTTDYWTKNKNEFQYLRDSLNLPLSR